VSGFAFFFFLLLSFFAFLSAEAPYTAPCSPVDHARPTV
jgi:hypothetical protein